ncbi:MAG: hypothetical protein AB8B69_14465 [Chitinophagales bacterium]
MDDNTDIAANTGAERTTIGVFIFIFLITRSSFFSLQVMTAMGMTFHFHSFLRLRTATQNIGDCWANRQTQNQCG